MPPPPFPESHNIPYSTKRIRVPNLLHVAKVFLSLFMDGFCLSDICAHVRITSLHFPLRCLHVFSFVPRSRAVLCTVSVRRRDSRSGEGDRLQLRLMIGRKRKGELCHLPHERNLQIVGENATTTDAKHMFVVAEQKSSCDITSHPFFAGISSWTLLLFCPNSHKKGWGGKKDRLSLQVLPFLPEFSDFYPRQEARKERRGGKKEGGIAGKWEETVLSEAIND